MEKEECEQLFREFMELRFVIARGIVIQDRDDGRPRIFPEYIPPKKLYRIAEVAKILKSGCKECLALSPSEWHMIEVEIQLHTPESLLDS